MIGSACWAAMCPALPTSRASLVLLYVDFAHHAPLGVFGDVAMSLATIEAGGVG